MDKDSILGTDTKEIIRFSISSTELLAHFESRIFLNDDIESYFHFPLSFKNSPVRRNVRLSTLSRRLDINAEDLIKLFNKDDTARKVNCHTLLTTRQLDVVLTYYQTVVKKLFGKFQKQYRYKTAEEKEALTRFFGNFISTTQNVNEETILKGELSESLIVQYFYKIIDSSWIKHSIPYLASEFNRLIAKLIGRITNIFEGIYSKIISYFITFYYNFSTEEDSTRANIVCFS